MKALFTTALLAAGAIALPASAQTVNCDNGKSTASCSVSTSNKGFFTATVTARWTNGHNNPIGEVEVWVFPGNDPYNTEKARKCGGWRVGWHNNANTMTRTCDIHLGRGRNVVFRAKEKNHRANSHSIRLRVSAN